MLGVPCLLEYVEHIDIENHGINEPCFTSKQLLLRLIWISWHQNMWYSTQKSGVPKGFAPTPRCHWRCWVKFEFEYLDEFKVIWTNTGWYVGAQGEMFDGKSRGNKSRETVPFIVCTLPEQAIVYRCIQLRTVHVCQLLTKYPIVCRVLYIC